MCRDFILCKLDSFQAFDVVVQKKNTFGPEVSGKRGGRRQGAEVISPVPGCSRTQFNGDYIQEDGQFYYRRPVFHCLEKKTYLFYHGKRRALWFL